MKKPVHKCGTRLWTGRGFGAACGLGARFEHEGEHYCGTHHPPSAKARNDARDLALRGARQRVRDELNRWRSAEDRRAKSAPILLDALKALHERLIECENIPGITVREAYDSFYREIVEAAIASAERA